MKHKVKKDKKTGLKTIAICSSASFYREVLAIERQLIERGMKVRIPVTAQKMGRTGDFNVENIKTWFKDPRMYTRKAFLMRHHLRKIAESDAILVVNLPKNGISGYIGGNVLIEMGVAFHLKKPIYLLHPIADALPVKEEVLGMEPKFLNGNLLRFG